MHETDNSDDHFLLEIKILNRACETAVGTWQYFVYKTTSTLQPIDGENAAFFKEFITVLSCFTYFRAAKSEQCCRRCFCRRKNLRLGHPQQCSFLLSDIKLTETYPKDVEFDFDNEFSGCRCSVGSVYLSGLSIRSVRQHSDTKQRCQNKEIRRIHLLRCEVPKTKQVAGPLGTSPVLYTWEQQWFCYSLNTD